MKEGEEYLGQVVYNEDPTYSGRCKIKVFGLFDSLDDDLIPWFTPINSSVFGGLGAGSISVPKLNTIVRVKFNNGDIYSGEYSAIQNIEPSLIDEIKDDYQGTHVLLYDADKNLIVMYQPTMGFKMYLGGSYIKVDADGSIQLSHRNNSNVIELNDNEINITTVGQENNVNGRINISAGSTVEINAPTVNVNSNNISLGKNASYSAVKAEKLIDVLKTIAIELDTKFPMGASTLKGRTFKELVSSTVKIA